MMRTFWGLFAVLVALVLSCTTVANGGDARPQPSREDRVIKTESEWRAELTPEEFRVLREQGTERAFTGSYHDDHADGVYTCAGCGLPLFSSEHKFDSGTGWPSYYKPIGSDRVDRIPDRSLGMVRTEVTCARCGGHLGHVFRDGPPPTGLRYCINSVSLDKISAEEAKKVEASLAGDAEESGKQTKKRKK